MEEGRSTLGGRPDAWNHSGDVRFGGAAGVKGGQSWRLETTVCVWGEQ